MQYYIALFSKQEALSVVRLLIIEELYGICMFLATLVTPQNFSAWKVRCLTNRNQTLFEYL